MKHFLKVIFLPISVLNYGTLTALSMMKFRIFDIYEIVFLIYYGIFIGVSSYIYITHLFDMPVKQGYYPNSPFKKGMFILVMTCSYMVLALFASKNILQYSNPFNIFTFIMFCCHVYFVIHFTTDSHEDQVSVL